MTTTVWLLLALALLAAMIDWWSVATDRLGVEFLAKPAVIICLIGVALAIHTAPGGATDVERGILIAALGASLVGDVVLMTPDARFEAGLAAFLLAHILYLFAFVPDVSAIPTLLAAMVAIGFGFAVVPRLLAAVRPHGRPLTVAVALYIVAVSAMGVSAAGTGVMVAAIGGMLFMISDSLLGWDRFVGPVQGGRVAVHVTYHLGQMGLVTWLAAS
ncbi:MAG: lysoplasmalogenase [Acidimicrobiales bacterium]